VSAAKDAKESEKISNFATDENRMSTDVCDQKKHVPLYKGLAPEGFCARF
jgi:hypothetical protein